MAKSPSHVTSGHKHSFILTDLQNTIVILSQPEEGWEGLLTHRQTHRLPGEKSLFLLVAGNDMWQTVLDA